MTRNWVWVLGAVCASALINACKTDVTVTAPSSAVAIDSSGNNGTGTGNTGTPSFVITPSGGNLTVNVGQTITVSSCKDASGNAATCTGSSITSNSSSITVSGLTITCTAVGATGTITVTTSVSGTQVSQTSNTFTCVAGTTSGVTGVTVSPNGGTYTLTGTNGVCQNLTIPFSAAVSPVNAASQAVTWTTSGGNISSSGVLTVSATGTYSVTATSVADPSKSFTSTVTVNANCGAPLGGTVTVTPNPLNFTLCGAGFTGTSQPQFIVLTYRGSTVSPDQVVYEQAGQLLSIDPVTGKATPANLGSSYVNVSPKSDPTNYVHVLINVTNTACTQNNTFSVTGPSSISSGQGCTNNTAQLVYNMNNAAYGGTVTWTSSNTGIATVNSNGLVTAVPGQSGTVTITATGGGGSATYPVNVGNASCQTGPMTVTVSPSTFNDVVGQQRTFTAQVASAPSGTTPSITWTVSPSTCAGQTSGNGTTFTTSWIAACQSVTVTATASAGGTQATGTATGLVTNGNVVCTISYNGTTSGSIPLNKGATANVTASCSNGFTSFKPYWTSSDPHIFAVQGATFVENIGGVDWYSGPTAVITGRNSGTANLTVQVDVRNPTPLVTRPVVVP